MYGYPFDFPDGTTGELYKRNVPAGVEFRWVRWTDGKRELVLRHVMSWPDYKSLVETGVMSGQGWSLGLDYDRASRIKQDDRAIRTEARYIGYASRAVLLHSRGRGAVIDLLAIKIAAYDKWGEQARLV